MYYSGCAMIIQQTNFIAHHHLCTFYVNDVFTKFSYFFLLFSVSLSLSHTLSLTHIHKHTHMHSWDSTSSILLCRKQCIESSKILIPVLVLPLNGCVMLDK